MRIILAQEDQERPSILFDTSGCHHAPTPQSPKGASAMRRGETAPSSGPTKSYFALESGNNPPPSVRSSVGAFQARGRGSTFSGGQAGQQSSSVRDSESRDVTNDLLECMFGASSSTKSGTRMHVIKGSIKLSRIPSSPFESQVAVNSRTNRKPTYVRAQTSSVPSSDTGHSSSDMVMVTRIFTVAPPVSSDSGKEAQERHLGPAVTLPEGSAGSPGPMKPPKLREKKTPAYALSLLVRLPPQRSSRPASRRGGSTEGQCHSPSASSSFGSDLQSSWTFLDALPPSLSLSRTYRPSAIDGQVDFVLRRWDVIGKHLSMMENIAKEKIFALLSQIEDTSNGRKTPKEKRMQRINQTVIRLPAFALSNDRELFTKSVQTISYVRSALSIPCVRPLPGGHWLEEARLVARLCSQKGDDRFFAILLTAFLGSHVEWINEIGRELHEERLLLKWKSQQSNTGMRSRTVIICEDRILARRLVFLLASFLFSGMLSLNSIISAEMHRFSIRSQHGQHLSGRRHHTAAELSKSVSSNEEDLSGGYLPANHRRRLQRNPSETGSLRIARLSIPYQDSSFNKSSAGTTTTVTPNPSTPLAYNDPLTSDSNSYFPTAAQNADGPNSAAAASLQRLRRSSSTASSMPSTWGSLLGSIWSNKQAPSAGTSDATMPSETTASTSSGSRHLQHQISPINRLESMAKEVGVADSAVGHSQIKSQLPSRQRETDIPPRLEVDEKDGVVDVDLLQPSSLSHSYASSPDVLPAFSTPLSTSTASLEDGRSFFSVRSSSRASSDHVNNIAGYLKQYHPDFVLQAVRSCSEKEVRDSMTTSSIADNANASLQPSYEDCSTLIADARNCSVKRLTLRRKAKNPEVQPTMASSPVSQDEFSLESIMSYDETLADAIARALDRPSAVPSRLPSPSPSKSQHFRTVSTSTASTVNASSPLATSLTPASAKDTLQPVPVPQRNRGQFIIDALKEVVSEVDRDLHKDSSHGAENIPVGVNSGLKSSTSPKIEGNILREGVKRWLQGAEETSVW